MTTKTGRLALFIAVLALGSVPAQQGVAGQPKKWEEVPEAVRATVLANGGKAGSVDLEGEKVGGKAVYEAVGKDKDGKEMDLVITEDGKLANMKYDGAADKAQEEAVQAKEAEKAFAKVKFSHPRYITNPYLPLASLRQDILEGKEGGKNLRIERTIKPEIGR